MIKELEIAGFTCFEDNKFEFSPNINVIIGKNGTGKTHILKLLATILSSNEILSKSSTNSKEKFESIIAEQLIAFFKPEQLGRLVRRQKGRTSAKINVKINNSELSFGFANNSKSNVKIENNADLKASNFLYIPPREMFSLYEGFLSLHDKREISFDETYVRLAKALDAPLLKGRRYDEVAGLVKPLEDELKASVIKENGRFYLKEDGGDKMEAHLVAEGLRKISSLMYLILNGELTKNSILFWDEPEANLNPKLITVIASFLVKLAEDGVQIFLSTHDYLLTHHLSLVAEYKKNKNTKMKVFCINKESDLVTIEDGDVLAAINNNPILDEFAAYYDLEQAYFNGSLKK